ncbi:MAG TPA: adenylate/guanylate cyclase domain-containing protein [Leptospiraceae bacterium]|nr:adenylate/guanylate cyclase domain-containing protein [Leptospiraceae bacterium]HRG73988.1 adenylate/guanylate cyclase domain-containing protein [Leptospiraceae bacterium]
MTEIYFLEDKIVKEEDISLSLLEISLKNQIPHVHACGGNARCSTCRVIILENLQNVKPRNEAESKLAATKGFEENIRLACQTRITGDVKLRRLVIDKEDIDIAISEKGETTGREKKVAVLFSDIRGFTTFSEKALPYDSIHILNRYFNRMGLAVLDNNGYIDKYIGDGLMAIFGLKQDNQVDVCLQAIKAGLQMIDSLRDLNHYLKSHFDLEFKIGIGIHFGNAILGELGHRSKRQFTAIGDTVNMASRIESTTKKAGASFLISSDMYEIVKSCVNRGRIFETKLKGKTGQYRLYEIKSLKAEHRLAADLLNEFLNQAMSIEEAPKFLRLAFHDAGNFDVVTNTGGANGSLRFELEREENLTLKPYFEKLESVKKEMEQNGFLVSYADVISFSGATAVYKTGGPKIYLKTGRVDATNAGNRMHFLSSDLTIRELLDRFSHMGMGARDLVILSGAHTIGMANGKPLTGDLYKFSNSYYKNLVEFCNGSRNESLGILNSDVALLDTYETKSLVELYARDEISFFKDFAEAYQKLSYLGQSPV